MSLNILTESTILTWYDRPVIIRGHDCKSFVPFLIWVEGTNDHTHCKGYFGLLDFHHEVKRWICFLQYFWAEEQITEPVWWCNLKHRQVKNRILSLHLQIILYDHIMKPRDVQKHSMPYTGLTSGLAAVMYRSTPGRCEVTVLWTHPVRAETGFKLSTGQGSKIFFLGFSLTILIGRNWINC